MPAWYTKGTWPFSPKLCPYCLSVTHKDHSLALIALPFSSPLSQTVHLLTLTCSTCSCSLLLIRAAAFTACLSHLTRITPPFAFQAQGCHLTNACRTTVVRNLILKAIPEEKVSPASCMPLHFWCLSGSYFTASRGSGCCSSLFLLSEWQHKPQSCSKGMQ